MFLPNSQDPTTPNVTYTYQDQMGYRNASYETKNPVVRKDIQRWDALTGPPLGLDTWLYTRPTSTNKIGTTTAPDGGVTTHTYITPQGEGRYLLGKTVGPEGEISLKYWEKNEAWGSNFYSDPKNIYVRAEYRKPAGGANYAATVTALSKNGNVKSVTEYDYGLEPSVDSAGVPTGVPSGGTILRQTTHDYHYETDAAAALMPGSYNGSQQNVYWKNFDLLVKGAKKRSTVLGKLGRTNWLTIESITEWAYDDAATTANITVEALWDSTKGSAPSLGGLIGDDEKAAVTRYTWSQGNLTSKQGPRRSSENVVSDETTFTYGPVSFGEDSGAAQYCPSAYTGLYPTSVTTHAQAGSLADTVHFRFDCATGLLVSSQRDAAPLGSSGKILSTRASYDRYGRNTSMEERDGTTVLRKGSTSFHDNDRWIRVASDLHLANDQLLATVYQFDGDGQLWQTRGTDDSSGAVTVSSGAGVVSNRGATRYNSSGTVHVESSPWRSSPLTGEAGQTWTVKRFDKSGRPTQVAVTTGTASTAPTKTGNDLISSTSYSYSGALTTETDSLSNSRTEKRDALGRLIEVTQGTLSPVKYWYDGRDHLVEVEQQDSTSYSGTKTQNRLFAYDSLGRLGSVTNPESGAESYTYWVDGQMKTKTNASSQVVNYAYDAARRLATKSFSGALNTTYCYDGKLWNGSACAMPAGRTDAVKGMKTGSGGAWGSTNYAAVDALGRVTSLKQTVAGLAEQSLSYEYSASGAVKSIGYPSGRQVNVAYTGAGRPSQLSSAARTYLSGMSYGANGALLAETWNGSGADRVEEKRSYNPLGQMLTADFRKNAQDSGRFWKMTNQFPETKNVGNLTKQYVETGIDTFGVRYAYDGLYRLIGAAEDSSNEDPLGTASCATVGGRWCVQYAYDQFGNGWTPSKSGLALGLAQASSNWYLQSSGVVNNRLKDVAYDASGRQRQWKVGDTSSVAVYDPEGHMTEAKGDSAVTPGTEKIYGSYLYNGDGQRVKSVADGKTVWYVYGLDGGVAAEFATGYTNVNAGKTLYPVTDHLGSTRAWFDQTGTVTQRVDYEPFGGEIQRAGVAGYSGVGDPAQKFTGKERDAETGLDYFGARYLMAGQGRFGSPDAPLVDQHVEDPQSWNLYGYVRNNPLSHVDPTGQACSTLIGNTKSGYCQRADLYANFDNLVSSKTRFFAAAHVATSQIADVAIPFAGTIGTSVKTRELLASINALLEGINTEAVGRVISGQMSGSGSVLDASLVHMEQTAVQKALDEFKRKDPAAYQTAVKELNALLNSKGGVFQELATGMGRAILSTDRSYARLLKSIRKRIGRDIDFGSQEDREEIGLSLVDYIKKASGCTLFGEGINACP
ncbi:RHS repeat domain-containing protein [Bryobacter aggregatus]|uniref:RHS repeat domain-containing protein n=1 Tax=Bryobacter aggregatus TaxID=360054 RepID=UPI001EE1CFAB|nr:RHS repeat-associated core domain-containing protein [Bryobacter aggregatus]